MNQMSMDCLIGNFTFECSYFFHLFFIDNECEIFDMGFYSILDVMHMLLNFHLVENVTVLHKRFDDDRLIQIFLY